MSQIFNIKAEKKGKRRGKLYDITQLVNFMQIYLGGHLCELGFSEHLKWHFGLVSGCELKLILAFSG